MQGYAPSGDVFADMYGMRTAREQSIAEQHRRARAACEHATSIGGQQFLSIKHDVLVMGRS